MERLSRSTYHWIAIVYLVLLTGQATGFSACQDPPQEIRISRGQKITVVYWVGQNALEDGNFQGKLATEIPQETESSSSSGSTVSDSDPSLGSTLGVTGTIPEEATSQLPSSTEESVNFRNAEISTESSHQSITTEQGTVGVNQNQDGQWSESPSTSLPSLASTSPIPALNANAISEEGSTPEANLQEEFGVSGRISTSEEENVSRSTVQAESTTSGVTPEGALTTEIEIATAQSENIDINDVTGRADEGISTVHDLSSKSELEGITSEVEYWSTTEISQELDEESTDGGLLEEKSVDVNTSSEEPKRPKSEEDSTLPTEEITEGNTEDSTAAENITLAYDLSPKSDDGNIANETSLNETIAITTGVFEISGRQQHDLHTTEESVGNETTAEDATDNEVINETSSDVPKFTEQVNNFQTENSIQGKFLDEDLNETETINSSSSSPVSLEVRASFEAETSNSIIDTTENVEITSEATTEEPSVFDSISTTIRNLFSTVYPSNEISPNTDALPDGRIPEVNATEESLVTDSVAIGSDIDATNIVFRNSTSSDNVTIDPRNSDNTTTDDISTILPEDSTESIIQSRDAINETFINDSSESTTVPEATESATEVIFLAKQPTTEAWSVAQEYDESETQDGELYDGTEELLRNDGPPLDIFVPINQEGDDLIPESDNSAEEARRINTAQIPNFESFINHNAPELVPTPNDGSIYDKEVGKKEFTKPFYKHSLKPIFIQRPKTEDGIPFPPPYFLRFPAQRNNDEPAPVHFPIFPGDLQQEASSSSGPYFPTFYGPDSVVLPPESPVHYVTAMRPPNGVLPIRSLRMSPDQSGRFYHSRSKRDLNSNDTHCQWNFKSDPGVPLLLTFKSFSTPETSDCKDHYIAVERESNGFQSRWCGVSGDRPGHASFARSEISLHLYSKGDGSFPTGFSVEVQGEFQY